ncbi:hypothetical protein [Deinococcus multiflagellatus]|uniref:hypothetical protein n=1 Tax=Deinococcus multiflagellatus TaxID=1656887 RepID=UPI001CCEE021|nr:hypothetical protein [Deinococcus multiflagellatus]MBZ9715511.1 hypothetical protein [Deinococcus multiflagellatus]
MTLPALPEATRHSLRTDLRRVVQEHITASRAVEVLGDPEAWSFHGIGERTCTTLNWRTPEGWHVEVLVSFKQEGQAWYGPWGSAATFRQDGHQLNQENTNDLALVLENCAHQVHGTRARRDGETWRGWYGEADNE